MESITQEELRRQFRDAVWKVRESALEELPKLDGLEGDGLDVENEPAERGR